MQPLECCRASAPEGVKLAAATQDKRDAATLQGCATRSKVQMVSWEEGDFRYKVFPQRPTPLRGGGHVLCHLSESFDCSSAVAHESSERKDDCGGYVTSERPVALCTPGPHPFVDCNPDVAKPLSCPSFSLQFESDVSMAHDRFSVSASPPTIFSSSPF